MSLASKKAKETKGKAKAAPKLKTILANPYQERCPTLDTQELEQLEVLFTAAIQSSGQQARTFATTNHIRLGLESCLRAINNNQASCVLLSLNIKPRTLINLISRNVKVKDETVPVFAQPQLEMFTEKIFGIRTLAFVLPKELDNKLGEWVSARKLPKKLKEVKEISERCAKKKKKLVKEICAKKPIIAPNKISMISTNEKVNTCETLESLKPAQQAWSGDFISFSNTGVSRELDKLKLEEDKNHLLNALSKMTGNAVERQTAAENIEKMDVDTSEKVTPKLKEDLDLNSDEFLQEYQPLVVHKIRPNPDKKPKKKRKNKNKKL